ncbi:MAG TPA: MotA/TolQ/ExbB proton channel family protein [Nitrospiraceae bacterium]|nr:MotA/TolQ/ExbB proton channel family protein [Nitrospiraceae bacterium]
MPAGAMGSLASLGVVSKLVLFALFIFSVVSWAIIIAKWRSSRAAEREEQQFLSAYAVTRDQDELRRQARRWPASPSATVFLGIMDRVVPDGDGAGSGRRGNSEEAPEPDRQYLDRVVGHVMQGQISRQEAYLPFLATTGNITPFIGLLGTVLGIIDAFQQIGKMGTASIAAVAPGVAEALVATAAGLLTAIPAVIAYNYFLTRIRKSVFRAESFSIEFMNALPARAKHAGSRT